MADIVTIEQLQNASLDLQTLSDAISGAPDTQVRSRLGQMIWTLATINSKIESVRVASDNAKTTIASYVTSVEQTKTQAQTDINNKVAAVYGGYFAAFDTLANLQASTGAKTGQVAKVMNDPTASNNGDYRYTGSAWVKGYDALADAKNYTDSRTAYTYEYVDGNKIGAKTPTYANLGLGNTLSITAITYFDSVVLRVNESDVLYLLNDKQQYLPSNGGAFAFFASDPNTNRTQTRIADNRASFTDTATSLTYQKVTVPTGANYLMLNTRFTNASNVRTDFAWTVNSGAFSNNYTAGKEVITAINGVIVPNYTTVNKQIDAKFGIKTEYIGGNEAANATAYQNFGLSGALAIQSASNYDSLILSVSASDILYFFNDKNQYIASAGAGFAFFAENPAVNTSQTALTATINSATDATSGIAYKYVVVPPTAKYFMFNTRFTNAGGTRTDFTWAIHKNVFRSTYGAGIKKTTALNGIELYVAPANNYLCSAYEKATVYTFGDSITAGTEGGWVQFLVQKLGCNLTNYGSSGASSARLVDIVTAGAGLPKRDSATSGTTWETKDFTNVKAITIQIGTNDYIGGATSDIPTGDVSDYANPLDYWALFPSNYVANIALCIEYIKSKNSDCEIFLISPPHTNRSSDGYNNTRMLSAYNALKQLSEYYSVPLIPAIHEAGIALKYMKANLKYSYDGTHFNALGNKLWGNYIAKRMLRASR